MQRERVRIYEVIEAAESPEERALTTPEKVNAMLGQSPTQDDELLEVIIAQVSDLCASRCGIARPSTGVVVPTFGRERIRVTWMRGGCGADTKLILPWRVPYVGVDSIAEDGIELEETDYQLDGAGILVRLFGDEPTVWSTGKIVAELTAGWELPDGVPADLEGAVIEQVKMAYHGRKRDPALRSETTQNVGAATYSVAGGDSIDKGGLLTSLDRALSAYRSWNV